jgi:hypothetical protein
MAGPQDRDNSIVESFRRDQERAFDRNIDLAHRAHDQQRQGNEIAAKQVEAFATLTIRTLGLVAAGGIAATLGFYSANYDHLAAVPGALTTLNEILANLMKSLFFIVVTPGLAYFSQIFYSATISERTFDFEDPYVHDTPLSERYWFLGDACRWSAVATASLALVALGVGGLRFLSLV